MNWEKYLKELIHIQPNSDDPVVSNSVWIGPWKLDVPWGMLRDAERLHAEVVERISIVVREALGEAIHVLPHEDPPLDEEQLDITRGWLDASNKAEFSLPTDNMKKIMELIDWQKARIAHMAKDNGYNDGVVAGEAAWNKENYEWIENIEYDGPNLRCPQCLHAKPDHDDDCNLGNYLRDNKPKS